MRKCTEILVGKGKQCGMFVTVNSSTGKTYKRDGSSKKGKLCGANHLALNPEARRRNSESCKLNYKRRDPFYMVEGIEIEEEFINAINTDSGVITEDQLQYL